MSNYHILNDFTYSLVEIIKKGNYRSIFYYECHDKIKNPSNIFQWEEGLQEFTKRSSDFYEIFLGRNDIDSDPATLHIALRIDDEFFVGEEYGSNYYLGSGPTGILMLRRACHEKGIIGIYSEGKYTDFLNDINKAAGKERLNSTSTKSERKMKNFAASSGVSGSLPRPNFNARSGEFGPKNFKKIVSVIERFSDSMQRSPSEYQKLGENNIRDRLLAPLNASFRNGVFGEAKNGKGKTDILVPIRQRGKPNIQFIFELKLWSGPKKFQDSIKQLQGYLTEDDNYAGIVIYSYQTQFSQIPNKAIRSLKTYGYKVIEESDNQRFFTFQLPKLTNRSANSSIQVMFYNIRKDPDIGKRRRKATLVGKKSAKSANRKRRSIRVK